MTDRRGHGVNTANPETLSRVLNALEAAIWGLNGMSFGDFTITFRVHENQIRYVDYQKTEKHRFDSPLFQDEHVPTGYQSFPWEHDEEVNHED